MSKLLMQVAYSLDGLRCTDMLVAEDAAGARAGVLEAYPEAKDIQLMWLQITTRGGGGSLVSKPIRDRAQFDAVFAPVGPAGQPDRLVWTDQDPAEENSLRTCPPPHIWALVRGGLVDFVMPASICPLGVCEFVVTRRPAPANKADCFFIWGK